MECTLNLINGFAHLRPMVKHILSTGEHVVLSDRVKYVLMEENDEE